MLQQALRRTPDRLVGQGGAAGDVVGVGGVGELHLEGVADGVVSLRQIGKDDADAGACILLQPLPGPLDGGADFIGLPVKPYAPLRLRRPGWRLVLANFRPGLFAAGEEIRLLAVQLVEAKQVQPPAFGTYAVGQLRLGD